MKSFAALLTCFSLATALWSVPAPKTLPFRSITIDDRSAPAVEFGAWELQKYLKLITGKHLPLRNVPEANGSGLDFVLALPDSACIKGKVRQSLDGDFRKLKGTDGYAVRRIENRIFLIADCPRGILNGVYRFLLKNTDIIWPRPAGELAIYTFCPDLQFQQTNYIDLPGFRFHNMQWGGNNSNHNQELALWTARQGSAACGPPEQPNNATFSRQIGVREGFDEVFSPGGHNLVHYWLSPRRFGKEHPEYYMLVDGRREVKINSNPCMTNPELAKALIERFKEELPKLRPNQKIIDICIADMSVSCECPQCIAPIKLPDGKVIDKDHPAFRSTQYYIFFNKIAKELDKLAPGYMIQQFAYSFIAEPPLVPVEPNILVVFCPYIRNYKEDLWGKSNEKWLHRTQTWLKRTKNLCWREYYGCGTMFPRPIADIAAKELSFLKKQHIAKVTTEIKPDDSNPPNAHDPGSDSWDIGGVEIWTLHQLFWDPDQDPAALRKMYIERTFREAAPAIERFYALIHKAWKEDPQQSYFRNDIDKNFYSYITQKNLLEPCRNALKEAEQSAKHPDSLALVRKMRAIFEKYAKLTGSENALSLKVPLVKCPEFPGFDLSQGVWAKAAEFPRLRRMRKEKDLSDVNLTAKIFCTGKEFYIGIREYKAARFLKNKYTQKMPHDTPLAGDHVKLFVLGAKERQYQFGFDYFGTTWDTENRNQKWNGQWEVRTGSPANGGGWVSVTRLPYRTLGFEPQVRDTLRFQLFVSSANRKGAVRNVTWGGGDVRKNAEFGTLEVEWSH